MNAKWSGNQRRAITILPWETVTPGNQGEKMTNPLRMGSLGMAPRGFPNFLLWSAEPVYVYTSGWSV